jgi:hypothetical protein
MVKLLGFCLYFFLPISYQFTPKFIINLSYFEYIVGGGGKNNYTREQRSEEYEMKKRKKISVFSLLKDLIRGRDAVIDLLPHLP